MKFKYLLFIVVFSLFSCSMTLHSIKENLYKRQIRYCKAQASKTLKQIPDNGTLPRSIPTNSD